LAPSDLGLAVEGLATGYGKTRVVFDASLTVDPGEVVALFGHNGAGKTTTLRAIFGLLPVQAGSIRLGGQDVTSLTSRRVYQAGAAYVPSEQFVFAPLTVAENLRLGALASVARAELAERLARVHELFPVLEERPSQLAGTMSGGQQRMLSLGVALMSNPSLLLLDEPSLGLSPALTDRLMAAIRQLADDGMAVLLLEQNIIASLKVADRGYVMRSGRTILSQSSADLRARDSYWDLF
jgi:branched-chain amino acid transport system ATP-binding protein